MPITTLPTPPNKFSDTVQEFTLKADTFLAALPDFGDEANALATEVNGKEASAVSAASTATTKANEAAASAASALAAPGTSATSTTSLSMSIGSKSLTIQTGKSFVVGMSVKIAVTAEPTRWMAGDITAYNSGTGALTVNVSYFNGVPSTFAAWTISISGPGGGGGGMAWETQSGNITALNGRGYSMDTTSSALTVTSIESPQAGNSFAVGDLAGTFDQHNCTIDFGTDKVHGQAVGTMTLDVRNQRVTFVYMNSTVGYIITDLTPSGSPFEYMPYAVMHVQDQKPSGTAGGSSIAGINIRDLNTVLVNEIAGASLASNRVTLQPGTYLFDISASCAGSGVNKLRLYDVNTGQYIAEGQNSTNSVKAFLRVIMTFTEQKTLELRHYTLTESATTGLGSAVSQGTEVYADLKITKIGGNYAPKPIISEAQYQTVAGLYTENNMMGFDASSSGNTVTVTKGSCLDSSLTVPLALTSDTPVVLPSTVNQEFFIFVVRLVSDGAFTVKAYTTYAGAAADGTIDAFQFVSWARNNGSGVTMPFIQVGERIDWTTNNRPVITASLTEAYVNYSLSTILPTSNCEQIRIGAGSITQAYIIMSYDGVTEFDRLSNTGSDYIEIVSKSSVYIRYVTTSQPVHAYSITLRR